MSSGSGNTGFVLGATTTTAGIAMIPSTGANGWLFTTAVSIVAGGLVMLAFYGYAAFVENSK